MSGSIRPRIRLNHSKIQTRKWEEEGGDEPGTTGERHRPWTPAWRGRAPSAAARSPAPRKTSKFQRLRNPGLRSAAARRQATYGLQRVGKELGDDPAAGAGEAVDQRVWHLSLLLLSNPRRPPSLPRFAGRRITAASRAKLDSTPPPPAGCFRRLLLGLLGLWETEARTGRGRGRGRGGVDSTRLSARRAHRGPRLPCFLFVRVQISEGCCSLPCCVTLMPHGTPACFKNPVRTRF